MNAHEVFPLPETIYIQYNKNIIIIKNLPNNNYYDYYYNNNKIL